MAAACSNVATFHFFCNSFSRIVHNKNTTPLPRNSVSPPSWATDFKQLHLSPSEKETLWKPHLKALHCLGTPVPCVQISKQLNPCLAATVADPTEFSASLDRRQRAAIIVLRINKHISMSPHMHILGFCLVFPKPLRLAVIPSVVYKLTVFSYSHPSLRGGGENSARPWAEQARQTCQLGCLDTAHIMAGFIRAKSEGEGSCQLQSAPLPTWHQEHGEETRVYTCTLCGTSWCSSLGGLLTIAKSVGFGDSTDLRASREYLVWKTLHPCHLRVPAGISPPQTFLLWSDSAHHRPTMPPLLLNTHLK